MEIETVTQLITTVGFPICMCLIMMYYIMTSQKQHKEEVDSLKESIQNNTIALTQLCERIECQQKGE